MEKAIDIGGQPPMYAEPLDLMDKINDYFNNGVTLKQVIIGKGDSKEIVEIPVPTITGLCLHAGFASRQSFYDYEKKEGFSYIIERARTFIEKHYEELLQVGNTSGAIFALKNMGWIDKVNTDITTKGESINTLTKEEAIKRSNELDDEY